MSVISEVGRWNGIGQLWPQAGTLNRSLFWLSIPLMGVPDYDLLRSIFTAKAVASDPKLSNTSFGRWIERSWCPLECKSKIRSWLPFFEQDSAAMLSAAQTGIEARKIMITVACAIAFYATRNLSIYETAIQLLSYSEKTSMIVLPILQRISQITSRVLTSRFLPPTSVVAFAPVYIKLAQIAFIYFDPEERNTTLRAIKTTLDKISQYVEALWHLRFSLLCLGTSKTAPLTALIWIAQIAQCLIPEGMIKNCVQKTIFLTHLLFTDFWPTLGYNLGLLHAWACLESSKAPYDIPNLQALYNKACYIKCQQEIENLNNDIQQSFQARKVGKFFLEEIVKFVMYQQSLMQLLFHQDFAEKITTDLECRSKFKNLFCPDWTIEKQESFINLLKELHVWQVLPEDNLEEVISTWLKKISDCNIYEVAFHQVLFQKAQSFIQNTLANWEGAEEIEQKLCKDCHSEGPLQKLAITSREKFDAHLTSVEFFFKRFEFYFQQYLDKPPTDLEKCKQIELHLCALLEEAQLDLEIIEQSPDFEQVTASFAEKKMECYLVSCSLFEFARTMPTIPKGFKFATHILPDCFYAYKTSVGAIEPSSHDSYLPDAFDLAAEVPAFGAYLKPNYDLLGTSRAIRQLLNNS
jgi:hypothetical protein